MQTSEFPLQVGGDDEMFVSYVTTAHQGVIDLGQPLACPPFSVVVRPSNDFQVDVVEALQRMGTPDENYSVDRMGGVVGAKNVSSADGSRDEVRWLEWKGTLDLTSGEGQHHLVRQILGFANRDPEIAQRWAEGYAYLIVGAEP